MGYAEAKYFDPDLIPVIDITPLRDGTNPAAVAKAMHEANKGIGFLYIKGHGIPPEQIELTRATALQFFCAPYEEKISIAVSNSHRGWLGPDRSIMHDEAKPDLKESFIWGVENSVDMEVDPNYVYGENKWPAFMPEMREIAVKYFSAVDEVAKHLLRAFAIGLGLNEKFFLQKTSKPLSRASFVYYPQQSEELGEDQFGAAPHTDFGMLTVLCQDSVGGLQVQDSHGGWVHAPPIEGSLIVNIGDLLSRWTDGVYRSTPHRVINESNQERISLVLAFDPDPDTIIDPRTVFGSDYVIKEPPISCGDYLSWRFNKAFL